MRHLVVAGLAAIGACAEAPDETRVAAGGRVYAANCARCHGASLEGQPDWRVPLPDGKRRAPPHDASGHTWHHSDEWLFHVVENGFVPPYARRARESDMPAFRGRLSSEEIRAVLAYIKSSWPEQTIRFREEHLARARLR